jgi:hypothetical protein
MRYARSINPAQTGVRLPTDDLPKELLGAVEAVNAALDRLDRGFQAQRDFLADAAHELRTPLAILAAHLDSMQDPARTSALRADVERMTKLVGQLLMVAQLEALTIRPDEQADLSEIAAEVAILLAPLAVKADRNVAVLNAEHPVPVRGNRDALYQALRNLVENALKYTPPAPRSRSRWIRAAASLCRIAGQASPTTSGLLLFQRFWRADRRQSGGAGWGWRSRIASQRPMRGNCWSMTIRAAGHASHYGYPGSVEHRLTNPSRSGIVPMGTAGHAVDKVVEIRSEIVHAGHAYWLAGKRGRALPARGDFDPPLEIPRLIPNMIIFDVLHEPLDFVYRLIGSKVRTHLMQDLTGVPMSNVAYQRADSVVWSHQAWVVEHAAPRFVRPPYVGRTRTSCSSRR